MGFWFAPGEPANLAVCRILFYGAFFLYYLSADFRDWGGVSGVFWMPMSSFKHLRLEQLSSGAILLVQSIWKTSLFLSCIGLLTPLSTAAAFICGFYLLGLPNNFGLSKHPQTIVVIAFGVMALSRCGDALSMDRLVRRARYKRSPAPAPCQSGEYTWPVKTVWFMFSMIFLAAGLSKLRKSGLDWIFTDNLRCMLLSVNYHIDDIDPLVSWGINFAGHPWFCELLALVTVVLEVSYPLTLFSKRLRWVLVPCMFMMQGAIRIVLGPNFAQYLICNLFWVPWDRLLPWLLHHTDPK